MANDKRNDDRESMRKTDVRDAEIELLYERLEAFQGELKDVEREKSQLVTSHKAEPWVEQRGRELDNDARVLQGKIKDTRQEIFELEEERPRETSREITALGGKGIEKNLKEYGKHGAQAYVAPEDDHGHTSHQQGQTASGSQDPHAPEPHGHRPAEPQGTHGAQPQAQHGPDTQGPSASDSHGNQGDWYRPGDWMGQSKAPDAAPPHPLDQPDGTMHASVGIPQGDFGPAHDYGAATATPMEALGMQLLVAGAYIHNRFSSEKEHAAEPQKDDSKATPEQGQSEERALPATPDAAASAKIDNTPQQASPSLPPTPDARASTPVENKPQQGSPSLPPTPDSRSTAEAIQPAAASPAPAVETGPER